MNLRKSKIYIGSHGHTRNIHNTSEYKKKSRSNFFFDFEKAFETNWKYDILKDLHNQIVEFHEKCYLKQEIKIRMWSTQPNFHNQEKGAPRRSIKSMIPFNKK